MNEINDDVFAAQLYEVDSYDAVQELCHSSRWTDGLPIFCARTWTLPYTVIRAE